jgi:pSer/pThr/pTyr-binding forkhead associated (FHA) protein
LPFKLRGEDGEHPLGQGPNIIGRTTDADIPIDRTEVSRHHCRIVITGTTATIEDLGSKNGTYLNGERLQQPTLLANGDEIWIGRSVARFRFLVEGEPTQTEHSVK